MRDVLGASTPKHAACSVFSPAILRSFQNVLIQVWLHPYVEAHRVGMLATMIDQQRGRQILHPLDIPLRVGDRVDIALEPNGLRIAEETPRSQSVVWAAVSTSVNFLISSPWSLFRRRCLPVVRLSIDGRPIGRVVFTMDVGIFQRSSAAQAAGAGKRYRKAFLSYSSTDRGEVLKRAQAMKLAGLEFYQDILHLEPGERWTTRLRDEIASADVFFLFWSENASRSKWVMKEAKYALSSQRNSALGAPDIVPVILQVPPPLPPAFLKHIHFGDAHAFAISFYSKD